MKRMTLSTVCVIAALAATPSMAAPGGKPDQGKRVSNSECTFETKARQKPSARTKERSRPVDCILVKGYPNQDGRAVLRKSLRDNAREDLSKVVRPTLKDLFGKGRTS